MVRPLYALLAVSAWVLSPDTVTLAEGQTNESGPSVWDKMINDSAKCDKEYLLFDFRSVLTPNETKQQFSDLTVIYSFKVYGSYRYIFVVENDQSQALKDFELPTPSYSQLITYPVERLSTFLSHFGISMEHNSFPPLPDTNLAFVERIWDAGVVTEEEYAALLEAEYEYIKQLLSRTNGTGFVPVARLPATFLFFVNLPDCTTTQFVVKTSNTLGGPGNARSQALRLYNA